jgi:N-acetylneuraminate lyase
MMNLNGIFPALLTPFTKANRINSITLRKLVQYNISKGVDGFFVGGSTGEAFLLTLDERREILEVVVDECKGLCPVIAHVGCMRTEDAISLAMHAQATGANAICSLPPFYYNYSLNEIKQYYIDLADSTDLPVIIYNIPGYSGVNIKYETIKDILSDSRFIGIKQSASDFFTMERIRQSFPHKSIYNGLDEMFLAGLSMGADGGIGSTYNFMAEKFISMKVLFEKGRNIDAQCIQAQVNHIIQVLISIGVIPAEKKILELLGFDMGESRKPFKAVNAEERTILEEIVKTYGLHE